MSDEYSAPNMFRERMYKLASRMVQEFGEQQIVSVTVKRPLFYLLADYAALRPWGVEKWEYPVKLVLRYGSGEIEIKKEET